MTRTRYLPPGSMRRQRRIGRLEGSVGMLALVCAIGAGLVAATPAELYRPAAATVRPLPQGTPAPDVRVEIPPCSGAGKDCSPEDTTAPILREPVVPQHHAAPRPLPEPGTLALLGAGVAALAWRCRA
ncbi:MAG: PEP-CTERM sorting domain-containing protein [Afipia sp.]